MRMMAGGNFGAAMRELEGSVLAAVCFVGVFGGLLMHMGSAGSGGSFGGGRWGAMVVMKCRSAAADF